MGTLKKDYGGIQLLFFFYNKKLCDKLKEIKQYFVFSEPTYCEMNWEKYNCISGNKIMRNRTVENAIAFFCYKIQPNKIGENTIAFFYLAKYWDI